MSEQPRFAPIVEPTRPAKPTTEHQRRQADRRREARMEELKADVERRKARS